MLPFMRFYRGNNLNLSKHIEKLKNGQLTLENILEEDEIIQDLKLNINSQFLSILTDEAIRKLIDYATKMPTSDDQKIGHKFPFNATELLCADNSAIQEKIMNESYFEESELGGEQNENKEKEPKEKVEEGDKKKEKESSDEKIEEMETTDEDVKNKPGFLEGLTAAINTAKDEQKSTENEKEAKTETEVKEEIKKEEGKIEENKIAETKKEAKVEESKPEEKPETETKEQKQEEKKEETKIEESKPEEKPETETKEQKAEEKKEETKIEESKPEETKPEETAQTETDKQKIEENQETKNEEKKPEEKTETKPEEQKSEEKEVKNEESAEIKKEETKPEELKNEEKEKEEKKPEEANVEAKDEEVADDKKEEVALEEIKKDENDEEAKKDVQNEEEYEEEDNGQHKHSSKDDEDEDNQKENEDNEESDKEETPKTVIYSNVDYLFDFLKESKDTVSNHVLVGYFNKILNHLISSQSIKIVQYIFDYPLKSKFDILKAIVSNLNRKSLGSIVNKLLLFSDESNELLEKKLLLVKSMLEELEQTNEKDKIECICNVLASTLNNKGFYISFMNETVLVDLLLSLLEKSVDNPKKLVCILNLLIKVNENVLKNLSKHCTKNLVQENPLEFMSILNYDSSNYPLDEKPINQEDMEEINKNVLLSLFTTLKKTEFKFFEDLGTYTQENEEFLTTYLQKQKKIGMKKLAQIEFLRTILDIFVNSYNSQFHEKEIEELILMLKNKNVFYNCHKLFFDFPFSNIYQSFYCEIVDIVINQSSPECLIEYFFKYSDEKGDKNLFTDLLKDFLNNLKFKFNNSDSSNNPNISFNPCSPFEITLLNKFNSCENEHVKKLFNEDNNLKVFIEVLGEEVDHIYNQKLLLSDTLGANFGSEDEKPPETFGKLNYMEIIEEDIGIYNTYKSGGDYKAQLNEKIEREKAERENMEQEIVGEEEENKDEHIQQDEDEENEEGIEEIGIDNEGEENKGEEVEHIQEEEKEEIKEEEKEKEITEKSIKVEEEDKKSESTEESVEDKQYNDVNFWNPEIKPNDDIMSSIINDIE